MSKFAIYMDSRDPQGYRLKMARRIMKISLKRKIKVFGSNAQSILVMTEIIEGYAVGFGHNPVPTPLNRANISYETATSYEFLDDPVPHIADGKLYVALIDLPKTRIAQATDKTLTHNLRTYICTRIDLVE